jgi:hypothetical protein
MIKLISQIFSVYIIVCVITSSSLFESLRFKFKTKFPKLQIGTNKHFIECRLCVGFWISIGVCACFADINNVLVVYGASYFLATQER